MSNFLRFVPLVSVLSLALLSATAFQFESHQRATSVHSTAADSFARADTGRACPPGSAELRSMVVGFVTSEGTPVIPVPRIDSSKNPPEPYTPPLDSSEMRLRSRSGRPEIGVPRMKPEDVRLVTDENGRNICQTLDKKKPLDDSLDGPQDEDKYRFERAVYQAGNYYFIPTRQFIRNADPDDFPLSGTALSVYDSELNGIRTFLY